MQVPYDLREDDTPDDWECQNNVWDENHASCSVPQELTDKEIDNILALQVAALLFQPCLAQLHPCNVPETFGPHS